MALTRPTAAQIATSTVDLNDSIIRINSGETGANTGDVGIIFERGSHTNAGLIWDENADVFRFISTTNAGEATSNVNISAHHNLHIGTLVSNGIAYPSSDGTSGQVIATDGNGNLTFVSQSSGGGYTASSTAPLAPSDGDEWWDTDDGNFYKFINDGTTSQWVEWGPNNSLNGNELITGNLIPDVDATYDIGSSSKTLSNIYATASSAKYADLAENYLSDSNYAIGTVLMIGGLAEVTIATQNTTAIVGTVSENPGYLMNSGLVGEYVIPVAYIGRVPCRVVGKISRGDLLVNSKIPGVAKSADTVVVGQLIGKALEDYNSETEGLIEILIGRL
jgi:hypothetical protein